MPDAYLGRNARYHLQLGADYVPLGAVTAPVLQADVTTVHLTIGNANANVVVPVYVDNSLAFGSVIPTLDATERASRMVGRSGVIVADYSGLASGVNDVVWGNVIATEGRVEAPYADLLSIGGTWPQADPWIFGERKVGYDDLTAATSSLILTGIDANDDVLLVAYAIGDGTRITSAFGVTPPSGSHGVIWTGKRSAVAANTIAASGSGRQYGAFAARHTPS